MSDRKRTNWIYVASVALVASACAVQAMSIEAEPVKVTHRNSGPRYDIESVERTKLMNANSQSPPERRQAATDRPESREDAPAAPLPSLSSEAEEPTPIGHVAIRRIFLFPMMRPIGDEPESGEAPSRDPQGLPTGSQREQENERPEMASVPSIFAKPFWPFMTPARPSHRSHPDDDEQPRRPHLFGADEASRSPMDRDRDQSQAASAPDRDTRLVGRPFAAPSVPERDPIQMMMDLMHQAINSQLAPNFTDLMKDKEAPSRADDNSPAESSDERPQAPGNGEFVVRPGSKNENREDIVEIDGKKFLRKVITNRHVGDNIIFMTRRLIFVPINETDATSTTTDTVATTTTTDSPQPTTTAPVAAPDSEPVPLPVDRVGDNKPAPTSEPKTEQAATTTSTSTTTTSQPQTTGAPSSSASPSEAPSSEQPTSSEPSVESTTAPNGGWVERGLAKERLTENAAGSSTPAPAATPA